MDPKEVLAEIRLLGVEAWFVSLEGHAEMQALRHRAWLAEDRTEHLSTHFPLPRGYYWDSWYMAGSAECFRIYLMRRTERGKESLGWCYMMKAPR